MPVTSITETRGVKGRSTTKVRPYGQVMQQLNRGKPGKLDTKNMPPEDKIVSINEIRRMERITNPNYRSYAEIVSQLNHAEPQEIHSYDTDLDEDSGLLEWEQYGSLSQRRKSCYLLQRAHWVPLTQFTKFSSLPKELRLMIFGFALDRTPQVVRARFLSDLTDQLKPTSPPPVLLHVNSESRDMCLRIYKPWLPQFENLPAHAPYAKLLAQYPPHLHLEENALSCLRMVYINFEKDFLFIEPSPSLLIGSNVFEIQPPLRFFGRIEESFLRRLAVDMDGQKTSHSAVRDLMRFRSLEKLYLFGMQGMGSKICRKLTSKAKRRGRNHFDGTTPPYRLPKEIYWTQQQSYPYFTDSEYGRFWESTKRQWGPPVRQQAKTGFNSRDTFTRQRISRPLTKKELGKHPSSRSFHSPTMKESRKSLNPPLSHKSSHDKDKADVQKVSTGLEGLSDRILQLRKVIRRQNYIQDMLHAKFLREAEIRVKLHNDLSDGMFGEVSDGTKHVEKDTNDEKRSKEMLTEMAHRSWKTLPPYMSTPSSSTRPASLYPDLVQIWLEKTETVSRKRKIEQSIEETGDGVLHTKIKREKFD